MYEERFYTTNILGMPGEGFPINSIVLSRLNFLDKLNYILGMLNSKLRIEQLLNFSAI